jgi:Protein of unknown function (DUF5672)
MMRCRSPDLANARELSDQTVTIGRLGGDSFRAMPVAVVVVPVYRPLTVLDRFSLSRCSRLLDGWPLTVIAPASLDTTDVARVAPRAKILTLPDRWFESKQRYSELLLTRDFYKLFNSFEFLLIHQLDCYVFEDQLADWCAQRWDYVAPPFFRDYTERSGDLAGVGCGGFSLRRTASFLAVCDTDEGSAASGTQARRLMAGALRRWRGLSAAEWRLRRASRTGIAEDLFWSSVPKWLPWLRIPPIDEAARFGFEMRGLHHMQRYYAECIPFGCHAIENVRAIYEMTHELRSPATDHEFHLASILNRSGILEI